jgi:hypothetical protein
MVTDHTDPSRGARNSGGDTGARAMFRAHYADLALMEDILRDSGLD